jgi:Ca-activated chloride channel family protein
VPRGRTLIAASLAVLIAGASTWVYQGGSLLPPAPDVSYMNRTGSPGLSSLQPNPTVPVIARDRSVDVRLEGQAVGKPTSAPLSYPPRDPFHAPPRQVEHGAPAEPTGRDRFEATQENAFKAVREAPVSTFSVDVDTASYSFMRASLNRNVLPQPAAVRTDELINYPWSEGRKLIRIGIKGYAVQAATRPRANLVFLIDTSGSMDAPNRLPLVKQSLAMLVGQLDANDRVAIVAYAGRAGTVLMPTAPPTRRRFSARSSAWRRAAAPREARAFARPTRSPSRISMPTASTE